MSKEGRPFEGILGNTIQLRLLENLIANGPANFNKRELGEVAGIARASTDKAIESFLEWGILKVSEKHGAMTLYALDFDSALVRSMMLFNESIIRRLYPSMLEAIDAEDAMKSGSSLKDDPQLNASEPVTAARGHSRS